MKMEHTESDRKVNIVITKKKKKPRNGFFSICVNDIYRSHYVMESGGFGFFFVVDLQGVVGEGKGNSLSGEYKKCL